MSYPLINEFLIAGTHSTEEISVSPYWVIAVARLKNRLTFDRPNLTSSKTDNSDLSDTLGDPLIITDCTSLSVSQSKGSHVSSMNATLAGGETKYMDEIFPGDWVMAWMVNYKDVAASLISRIEKGKEVNRFDDGLKFVGRVQSIRKMVGQQPGGLRTLSYSLNCSGFNELDSETFFDPAFSNSQIKSDLAESLFRLGAALENFIQTNEGAAGISTDKAIPLLLEILLGAGIPPAYNSKSDNGQVQEITGLTYSDKAPYAYLVPKIVGDWLGKTPNKGRPKLAYADILELIHGIQRYTENDPSTYANFIPDGIDGAPASTRYTGNPLTGTFTPQTPTLANQPVWSILCQYLNPTINEMYTTLRVNPENRVVPTLVVRQKPFSTQLKANPQAKASDSNFTSQDSLRLAALGLNPNNPQDALRANALGFREGRDPVPDSKFTPFLELPRWQADPVLIKALEVGRSDALRFNFIHIYGETPTQQEITSKTAQLVQNPPISDSADIKLHGLRSINSMVACSLADGALAAGQWMDLVADFNIGLHLSLSGTCVIQGVSAPIAVGDNFEFDGVVYHIEAVSHNCLIGANGAKSFVTNLTLSYGQKAEYVVENPAPKETPGLYDDGSDYHKFAMRPDSLDEAKRTISRFDAVKAFLDPGSTEEK